MVLLGIAFLVVGVVLVYLVTKDDGGGDSAGSSAVRVVVPTADIPAGTLADEVTDKLKEVEVTQAERLPDAVGSIVSLKGAVFSTGFAKNQQITSSGIRIANVRGLEVPAGYEAVAVQVDFVAGAAEYVGPGDKINLYAVTAKESCFTIGPAGEEKTISCPYSTPRAELLLTNVDVLDVSNQQQARVAQTTTQEGQQPGVRSSGESITYLLALKTVDVEKVIFQASFQSLYATLVAKDAPPAGPTSGRDFTNILEEEPNVAFNR
jgi:Flp pilus assembly protein CpaB